MDTASIQFVIFGLAAALLSNLNRSPVWRSLSLFASSAVFLALLARNAVVLIPLIGFLMVGYAGILLLSRGNSRLMVWIIVGTVFVYIWLKKYTFLPESLLLHAPFFSLGISYIFFRVLHLVIETGEGNEKRAVALGAYLLYTLNFTTLVSGPLQRYDEFAQDQFATEPLPLGPGMLGLQMERIVRGFFKVNVLAMLLNAMHEDAVAQMSQPIPTGLKLFAAFRLTILYPLFLYANFSGYIDIVIALARLMRVRLPENFDRPFSASSPMEFWNRWHITVSTWFKTYVYNPLILALMRRISSRTLQPLIGVFGFFVTFFLVGIWHGRTSEFVIFGLLTGGGVSINKIWQLWFTHLLGRKGYSTLAQNAIYVGAGRGFTFSWFALSLFWFWGKEKQIHTIFASLDVLQWIAVWLAIFLCASLVLNLWESLRTALLSVRTSNGPVLTCRYARVVYASAMGSISFVITVVLNQPAPGIVYKAF